MIESRDMFIDRIRKEIIGPGSDIFLSDNEYEEEVIEGKPLMRYYSGILFPPITKTIENDIGQEEDTDEINEEPDLLVEEQKGIQKADSNHTDDSENESVRISPHQYFPTNFGFTFCVKNDCKEFGLDIKFGTYKKSSFNDLRIHYAGEGINYLEQYGLHQFIDYNPQEKYLFLKKELTGNRRKAGKSGDYFIIDSCIKSFSENISRNHILLRNIKKLVYGKDKWKRSHHKYSIHISLEKPVQNFLKEIIAISNLSENLKDGIRLYTKVYSEQNTHKKYVKVVLENAARGIKEKKYNPSNEKLNRSCLFQVELIAHAADFLPFQKVSENEYNSDEDKKLNFLYEGVNSFGVGHGVACEWDNFEKPSSIKTTFFPNYDVKSQHTSLEISDAEIQKVLDIKNLSSFSTVPQREIINSFKKFSSYYKSWINEQREQNGTRLNKEIGILNIAECDLIHQRIEKGINILESNQDAFRAFQYANSAIYIQMFHTERYFSKENHKGFELHEWNEGEIPKFNEYQHINYPSDNAPRWRPFQLGFILISLLSIIDPKSDDRNIVDLIWFPTGGGKTEAYLTVVAFLIFFRRIRNNSKSGGVNAIIRYTLRLLTAQQFERATKVILSCEKIRRANSSELGNKEISIGFWVGDSTIPNTCEVAEKKYNSILERLNNGERARNIFQVNSCQWCNTKIITKKNITDSRYIFGVRHSCAGHGKNNSESCLKIYCNNPHCDFSKENGGFPIVLIDDDIYKRPPTLLFGTIDKFAMLAWREEGIKLFNQHTEDLPPELIIQDELHLISGPLGSIAGLYENTIQSLCTKGDITPKIITSTATTKNAKEQVRKLYGKEVSVFPPFALNIRDNFFSRTQEKSTRRYIGIIPTGKNFTMSQLKLLAAILYARLDILKNSDAQIRSDADKFWTIISYFNSLKDVGRMANKIGPELRDNTLKQLHNRLLDTNEINYKRLNFAYELTSRIHSDRIKETLDRLQLSFDGNLTMDNKVIDLVLATNMISVGLDVQRLGVMLVNGMPRNIAEYIQSTSRVARKNKGIVITLFNADNSRDLSYFEHFISFHQRFYKEIEPLSLTPFTISTFNKMLFTSMITFFRHKLGHNLNRDAKHLNLSELVDNISKYFEKHIGISIEEKNDLIDSLTNVLHEWEKRIAANSKLLFKSNKIGDSLLRTYSERLNKEDLLTMQSVRNVEPSAKIHIQQF